MLSLLLIRGFYVNDTYMQALMKFSFQNNHLVGRILITYETKISPGPEIEPGSPGVRASSIITKPTRRSTWPGRNIFSYWIPPYPPEALVPSIRDGGEHLC